MRTNEVLLELELRERCRLRVGIPVLMRWPLRRSKCWNRDHALSKSRACHLDVVFHVIVPLHGCPFAAHHLASRSRNPLNHGLPG
jgi:hypothetical protein